MARRAARSSTGSRSTRRWWSAATARRQARGRRRRVRRPALGRAVRRRARRRPRTGCGRSARSRSSLCQVAAARFDAMASLKRCRAVDAAAAQLIVREAGGLVSFIAFEDPLAAPLDLEPHSPVIAARTEAGLADVREGPGLAAGERPWQTGAVIDWNLAGTVARGVANLQPAGDPAPFEQLAGPAEEAERLVSAYTGLVPVQPVPVAEAVDRAGLDRGQPGRAGGGAGARRRSGSRGNAGPFGTLAGGVLGDRGGRRLRVPRRARAGPVRVPGARARRARAAAVRRAEPRARGQEPRRPRRPAAALGRAARDDARAAVRRRPVAAPAPEGDARASCSARSSSTRAACCVCPMSQISRSSSSGCARTAWRRS